MTYQDVLAQMTEGTKAKRISWSSNRFLTRDKNQKLRSLLKRGFFTVGCDMPTEDDMTAEDWIVL